MKGALHLLFEIEAVCILNHSRFFGISMLFAFFFHFECSFGVFFTSLVIFIVYNHAVTFGAVFFDDFAVAGCIVPSDGFASASSKGRGTSCPYGIKKVNSQ